LKAADIKAVADYNMADQDGFAAVKIDLPNEVNVLARTVDSVQVFLEP